MIIVSSNKAQFEYDIHSLIKAFYPEEEVRLITPESVVKDKNILNIPPTMTLTFKDEEVVLNIDFSQKNMNESTDGAMNGGGNTYIRKLGKEERADYKNAFKSFLYKSLSKETKTSLPWGNLIGIRPTKIAMSMLEQGKSDAEIMEYLRESHMVSDEKAALSIDIAKREKAILESLHYEDGYSLYIGIPFCPTTCLYCSFTSFPISVWKERVSDYLEALEKEMDYIADIYRHKILDTIYIGGGTPTSLNGQELDRLLGKIKASFDLSHLQEFTVEAGRADSITKEKLNVLLKYGVSRISINPQTMKNETLKLIGRHHTVEQVADAFNMARKVGFDNINMDIILGLPGENEEDVKETIQAIEKLSPDSLTVHSLAVKRAARLTEWVEENGISALRNTEATMNIAKEGAGRMGMKPYYLYRQKNMSGNFENVGYAKAGKYGIYNILIMEEVQTIVALGAGTITKRVYPDGLIKRCDNVKDVAQYIERIDEMIERKRKLFED